MAGLRAGKPTPSQTELKEYRTEYLQPFAAEIGPPPPHYRGDKHPGQNPNGARKARGKRAQREDLLPKPGTIVAAVAGGAAAHRAVKRLTPGARSLLALGAVAGGALLRHWLRFMTTVQQNNYLREAARQVHLLLENADAAVPAYVVGHTQKGSPYATLATTLTISTAQLGRLLYPSASICLPPASPSPS